MAKQKIRSDIETQTKSVGITMPLPLHQEFSEVAAQQKLNASALLRKLVIQHLDEMRK